jgi:hypothetical protein
MNKKKHKDYILSKVEIWAGGLVKAEFWYSNTVIPSIGMTAEQAVEQGRFEQVKQELERIELGGFS